jgi:serine phosphatase RsbU (regulator of sigma subunit)
MQVKAATQATSGEDDGSSGIAADPRGRRLRSSRPSVDFLRALARALRDPATYDLRSNAGLWLGLVLSLPIPVLALASDTPPWMVIESCVAPLGWAVVIGACARVGILRSTRIQEMGSHTVDRERIHEEAYLVLHGAVENERDEHRRLERLQHAARAELVLGQTIQQSLVPADIEREDLAVALRHIPCFHLGGDYIQASVPRPDLLYLCVGDVSGHGVAAALVVSRLHALVQGMILEEVRPGPFLEALNHAALGLFEQSSFFMTFAVLRVDLSARSIEYATAGHPAQYLLRSGRDVEDLFTPNVALGLQSTVHSSEPSVGRTTYAPGDSLLLFTDGIFETRAPGRPGIWGEENLRAGFERHALHAPEDAVAAILGEAIDFCGIREFDDDVSLLVARLGVPRNSSRETFERAHAV